MMRLCDGFIQELDYGLIIELRAGNFACASMILWQYIFSANGDNNLINEMITLKIEWAQQKLNTYLEAANDQA